MNRTLSSGLFLGLTFLAVGAANAANTAKPLALHPDNPHYLLFRDRPTVLVASGEHYGAVLNLDFDYLPYLDELKANGLNLTRAFSGTYREVPNSFGIEENTLAPRADRFLCPWTRTEAAGAGDGGAKFDLSKFDARYFDRLKDFIAQAGKRGVVVELSLFCTLYDDDLWAASPMKASNNTQGIGKVRREEVVALKEAALTEVQEAFVRKVAAELNGFDNLYYEICNEPYFAGVTLEWQHHMIDVLVAAEKELPHQHLIAQNIANGSKKIDKPHPQVSVFNFHYATPPEAVAANYGLNRVIGDDETGFRGTADLPYRTEAWEFLVAGGAIFSHLDYSFTAAKPAGTHRFTKSPGGGGPALRKQLRVLKEFMDGFDLVKMRPSNEIVKGGTATTTLTGSPAEGKVVIRALAEPGRQYAVYVRGGTSAELFLDLPAGAYHAEWVNSRTGQVDRAEEVRSAGGQTKLVSPPYSEDIALRLKRNEN